MPIDVPLLSCRFLTVALVVTIPEKLREYVVAIYTKDCNSNNVKHVKLKSF